MKRIVLIALLVPVCLGLRGQSSNALPVWDKSRMIFSGDWLIGGAGAEAALYRTVDGQLVLSNGIVCRTFSVTPDGATTGLDLLNTNESFLRSVRPEAEVEIDGIRFSVGGLTGQPIHNYLLPRWLEEMKADRAAFRLVDYTVSEIKERFPWKKRAEWMPQDMPWPPPGKEVTFSYRLDDEAIRLTVEKLAAIPSRSGGDSPDPDGIGYLKNISVEVHYELYDGMPLFSKWIKIVNGSEQEIVINAFKSEILALAEPESAVDSKMHWLLPNITIETDYNFGGMTGESVMRSSVAWNIDTLYSTQVCYQRNMPCLLEAYPRYGPDQHLKPGSNFESFRTWELIHDSRDRERKGLEHRRMMRALAPWSTENPILMHVRSADPAAVRKAVDQCAEVGFELIIMTFGSGFNIEDDSPRYISAVKELTDYAHSKGIALGGYSLLASRSVGDGNDVVMPEGRSPVFGNSPCLGSNWGIDYFRKLYEFYEKTGMDVLEHDGSYPGDICISESHPGHAGLDDSQWNQYRTITDFYKWCRSEGIYLNVPDYYFLSGSNKIAMGYRETNWSLPREQQEIIERQNIYDGTWEKTPSMGWMFVPLVEYQGGGAAATIEPLKDHLPHYGQRLANLFGAGVQACYRGPQLYDSPETKALVEKWVGFYKKHRRILDGDIIHLRRADGRDYDAILHVDPQGVEKGLLMVYNPLDEEIQREITVPVYYTGLSGKAVVREQDGREIINDVSREYTITLPVTIPARGYNYWIIK
ncbi:MAG: alpha-galactosidase [Bacteroidales bacterium]|nr:alpha-galactosidase [Bacteroidales bacterium]